MRKLGLLLLTILFTSSLFAVTESDKKAYERNFKALIESMNAQNKRIEENKSLKSNKATLSEKEERLIIERNFRNMITMKNYLNALENIDSTDSRMCSCKACNWPSQCATNSPACTTHTWYVPDESSCYSRRPIWCC